MLQSLTKQALILSKEPVITNKPGKLESIYQIDNNVNDSYDSTGPDRIS